MDQANRIRKKSGGHVCRMACKGHRNRKLTVSKPEGTQGGPEAQRVLPLRTLA